MSLARFVDFQAFMADESLMQIYVDRIIAAIDRSRLLAID